MEEKNFNEEKFIENLTRTTGYTFGGEVSPEYLNREASVLKPDVSIKLNTVFRIAGIPNGEFVQIPSVLYVKNGMYVRYVDDYAFGRGFSILSEMLPYSTVRINHVLDTSGKQIALPARMEIPSSLLEPDRKEELLCILLRQSIQTMSNPKWRP